MALSYEREQSILRDVRSKLIPILRPHNIDPENNTINPTDDENFIQNMAFYLLLMAKSQLSEKAIPEDWQLDPELSKNLAKDEVGQRVDTALHRAFSATTNYKTAEAMQRGDLFEVNQKSGLDPRAVAARLVLDKERAYVDAYHEITNVYLALITDLAYDN